jgi:integrase
MPRQSKGAHLWLRPERDRGDKGVERAVWVIKDGGKQISTGFGAGDRALAEKALADHIAAKYGPARRERDISEIMIADVLSIYARDVAPGHARPWKTAERCERLLEFFGAKTLADINGAACRSYATWRGSDGGARRDLQDLSAAIGHHQGEGLHRSIVKVVLPARGRARQRWMTRSEVAKLLWTCWRHRETQEGKPTDKRPLRHLVRLILIGVYTGSRPGAILNASWQEGDGRSFVDIDNGVFHRHGDGEVESTKRQPTVRLSPRLLAHLRRWKRLDRGRGYVVSYHGAKVASVKTAIHTACKLAEVDSVTAYTLRHTAASWLVTRGLSTRKVAEFIGTGEQMVLNHYGHLAPDYQNEAAEAIGGRPAIRILRRVAPQ